MTLKEVKEGCEAFKTVGNCETFVRALPFMMECVAKLRIMSVTLRETAVAVGKLQEKVNKYALDHESVFEAGRLLQHQSGAKSGDVVIDGVRYHFVNGYGEPVRADGEMLTQDFLSDLPEGWVKAMLKLDTGGIKDKVGKGEGYAEALEEHGLVQSVKNKWEIVNDSTVFEGSDK